MRLCIFIFLAPLLALFTCTEQKESASPHYKGPIIDMHIHAFAEGHPMFGMQHPPTLRGKTYLGVKNATEQKKHTFEMFKKYNIVKAVVANGQLWAKKDENRVLIGRNEMDLNILKQAFNSKKLHLLAEWAPFYAGMQANDPKLMPFFKLAESLHIPIGFHIFPGGPNNGMHIMPHMLGGMRVLNANPSQLDEVLAQFPNLRLYIMHGGWPYVEDVKALMYMHHNLYVDIAVLNWALPQKELEYYIKALIDAGFGARIMFGSDQMVWPQIMDDAVSSVNAIPFLSLEQKEDIFYDNAATFLGLTEEEIKQDKKMIKN